MTILINVTVNRDAIRWNNLIVVLVPGDSWLGEALDIAVDLDITVH